ncbi:MAG: hypothetical protein Kow0090_13110 [Myxococcota bacterium]
MAEQGKTSISTTKLWLKQNQRRWIPAAVIIAVIIAVMVVLALASGGKKKPKEDYMKLLEERQKSGLAE